MGEYSNLFVCLMGLGTVFFGLICIIFLMKCMSYFCRNRKQAQRPVSPVPVVAVPAESNRQEMIAAVSAALAEELGTDISGIRILSFKKV